MKRFFLMTLCGLLFSLASNAQQEDRLPFAQDKFYASASLSNLNLHYNKDESWKMALNAKCGYLFVDDWMVTANLGYDWHKKDEKALSLGAGIRYYIEQNGLYLGAGANYVHQCEIDDFRPTVQLGYAFFLNRTVTIEPEVYYDLSLKNHQEYSGFGIRLGLGIYFE